MVKINNKRNKRKVKYHIIIDIKDRNYIFFLVGSEGWATPRLTRFLSHSVMLPPFLRHSRNSRERSERRGERVTMEGARYAHWENGFPLRERSEPKGPVNESERQARYTSG